MNTTRFFGVLFATLVSSPFSGALAGEPPRRAAGYAVEPEAVYQAIPSVPKVRAFLPAAVDLSNRMPPPGNQGPHSACSAWAVAYAARSYYASGQQQVTRLDAQSALSPAYVFNRLNKGSCDRAVSILDILTVIRDEGVVPSSEFPYDLENCRNQPSPALTRKAAAYRLTGWHRLETSEPDAIKGQIANGHPVILPLNLPTSFDRFEGSGVYNDRPDRNFPHAMVVVGYDDQRQAFRFMNSWDTDWGDGGFIWIDYRAYAAMQLERAYVIDLPPPERLPAPPAGSKLPQAAPLQPAPAVPVAKPLPMPQLASLDERIHQHLGKLSCADVQMSNQNGRLLLQGFAGKQDEIRHLYKALLAEPGVIDIQGEVALKPWPQCEVLLNFRQALGNRQGLRGSLNGASRQDSFLSGDQLRIDIVTPDFPAYLYVSYLQTSGEVVHLQWPADTARPMAPGSNLRLGQGNFTISPPFGDEAVIIIASAKPLFIGEKPRIRDDRDYLSEFRRAFEQSGQKRIEALMLPLRTMAR